MPKYKKDVKMELTSEQMEKMLENLNTENHRIALILLYLTGARPSEVLTITKKDFTITDQDIKVFIKTLKRGDDRTLIFDRTSTPFADRLVAYLEGAEDKLFSFSSDARLRQIVYKASDNTVTPYTLRHNRHGKLAKEGASIYELMYWKGSKDPKSVIPYVMKSGSMVESLKKKVK